MLKHEFTESCKWKMKRGFKLSALFENVTGFDDFIKNVKAQSKNVNADGMVGVHSNENDKRSMEERAKDKFFGDVFELFVEGFLLQFGTFPGIDVIDYVPVLSEDDYGVDGLATNKNGEKLAVQIKYRSRKGCALSTNDGLANFYMEAHAEYGITPTRSTMVVVSTANRIEGKCKERMRLVGIEELTQFAGQSFWLQMKQWAAVIDSKNEKEFST
jgi:hypothetical protein